MCKAWVTHTHTHTRSYHDKDIQNWDELDDYKRYSSDVR